MLLRTSKVRPDTVVVSPEEVIQEVTHVPVDIVTANAAYSENVIEA